MTSKFARRLAVAVAVLLVGTACERELTDLEEATFPSIGEVFIDGFGPGVDFAAFGTGKLDALSIDEDVAYSGTASLRFEIPAVGDPTGGPAGFAGGAFYSTSPRDLSAFNALTFWARASRRATLDLVGFGDDIQGNDEFATNIRGLELFNSWQQFTIPIPDASQLTAEGGLLLIADGSDDGEAYTIWIDEVQFESLASVGTPEAELFTRTAGMAVGDVLQAEVAVSVPVGGSNIGVNASTLLFEWTSSAPAIATVSPSGLITKVASGTAQITATLSGAPISGAVTVEDGVGLAGVVFDDGYGAGVFFDTFGDGADPNAVSIDDTEAYRGTRSLRISVPGPGSFAGGVFKTNELRNLTASNALVFWAKAATATTFDIAGIGNDNSGTSQYIASRSGLSIGTDWQQYIIPIPNPARLDAEGGLFWFAQGGDANSIWLDEVSYQDLDELGDIAIALTPGTETLAIGETTQVEYAVTFPFGTETIALATDARSFDWSSTDNAIATVDATGLVTMVAEGSADITAAAGAVQSTGTFTVTTSGGGGGAPTTPAPTPTQDSGAVISVYSNSYTNIPNEGLNRYGAAGFEEVDIAGSGNTAVRYTLEAVQNGNFQIIELGGANIIDAAGSGMTNLRFDVYFPTIEQGVSEWVFGTVNIDPGNPPASRGDVRASATSTPAIAEGQWLSFDVPISSLGLTGTSHIQQFAIDMINTAEVYVDNIYLYNANAGGGGSTPSTPAPTPTQDGADVISIFSDSYTDVTNEGYNRYGAAGYEVVDIGGNSALKYTLEAVQNGNFQIIELGGANVIDAAGTGMTNLRFDVYFPTIEQGVSEWVFGTVNIDPGNPPASRGDVRASATSTPVIAEGQWLSFDVPIASLGLTGTSHIQQFAIDMINTAEAYVDNIYLYDANQGGGGSGGGGGGSNAPSAPAPTPTQNAADVISIFSDSYTDVTNEGYNRYGAAGYEVVDIAGSGNSAIRYTLEAVQNGNFQIIELGGANVIDAAAAGMTNLRFDVYFPTIEQGVSEWVFGTVNIDPGNPPASRGDVRASATSTPVIAEGVWLSFDIPIASLNLTGTSHIQQFAIDMVNTAEVYIDNIYLYDAS